MADEFRRPGPYVPLSTTFGTGRTGSAIYERFGLEGIGAWAMMIAAAAPTGTVTFRHEQDWLAIGVIDPPEFSLEEFLKLLGQRKQTRKTRHGHVIYVELTRWTDWNKTKEREQARRRMSRYRGQSERNTDRNSTVTPTVTGPLQERNPDTDTDTDKPKALDVEEKQGQNGVDPFGLASRYVDNTGWQDPHLEEELQDRWPVLSPEEVAELIARARAVASRQEVA